MFQSGNHEETTNSAFFLPNTNQAPELTGVEPIGERIVRLNAYRGKVVLLAFWTLNCLSCRHVLHVLNRVQRVHEAEGLQVIGVHSPKTPEERKLHRVISVVQDQNLDFQMVADQNGKVAEAYGLPAWPSLFLLDRKGEIFAVQAGSGGMSEMEMLICKLLKKQG